jgi:thioredoxin reductase (NADPH)
MEQKNIPDNVYDIIIIGGGPAGLTAGLYASRARMNTLLIESFSLMGQATMTDKIENYPGIQNIGGFKLVDNIKKQAVEFGLKLGQGTINKISFQEENGLKIWSVEDELNTYKALSVIIASGASSRKIGVPGEKEFLGKGVSYCATCDGPFFKDKDIMVVGGGDTAVEEALYLTKFANKVKIVHRRDRFRATKVLQERVANNKKISFIWDSVVEEIRGEEKIEKVLVENVKTNEQKEVDCAGVFIFVGWLPNTGFVKDILKLSERGAIPVNNDMETECTGLFAAGDCTQKILHQIVTACGDGATAAFNAQQFVEELKGIAYK